MLIVFKNMMKYFTRVLTSVWNCRQWNMIVPDDVNGVLSQSVVVYEYRGVILEAGLRHVEPYLLHLFHSEQYRRWVDQFHEQKRIRVVKFTLIDIYRKRNISPNDNIWFFHGYGTSFDTETNHRNNNTWALCSEEKDAILVVINVKMSENIQGDNINKFILLFENQSFATGGYRIEAFTSYRYTQNIDTPNTDELEKVLGMEFRKNDKRLKKMIGSKSWSNTSLCSEIIHQWCLEVDFTEKEYLNMCLRCNKMRKNKEMCVRIFDWDNIDIILNEIGDYKASDMVRRYRFMKQTEKIEMNIYDDTDYYNVSIRNQTTIFEPNNRV
jgi:hypothetical protein